MTNPKLISIISPVYQAEETIDLLITEIDSVLDRVNLRYEIILVEDGGSDASWMKIQTHSKSDKRIKGIKLSRNFGQHRAVTAGIEFAQGDCLVILDCDLQDDPNNIEKLVEKSMEGFDIVFTKRIERKHNAIKKISSFLFNSLFIIFSDKRYDINYGSMVLLTKKVQKEYLRINDNDRLYIQLLKWLGFNQTSIPVNHRPRTYGESTYSVRKLIHLAIAGWTSNSDKLLRLSIYIGLTFSITSILSAFYIIGLYFMSGFQSGWASIFVLILFSTGLILSSIGVVGIYLGKTFVQSKSNPLFIIEDMTNLK